MPSRTLTHLLVRWERGDRDALEQLAPLVYRELGRLAAAYLRRERRGGSFETGVLVHEAFLRLLDQRAVHWQNRTHFYGVAALMMRRVLVDHARRRGSARFGQGAIHVSLAAVEELAADAPAELLALDDALRRLDELLPEVGKVVELRYFVGLEEAEVAHRLGVSVPTVKRRWRLARAWLHQQLSRSGP